MSWATDEERLRSAEALYLVKYMNVVSCTILVRRRFAAAAMRLQTSRARAKTVTSICDWLYTLDLEISLIWSKRWNSVKIVFLLSRYTAFIDVPLVLVYSLAPNRSLQVDSVGGSPASRPKACDIDPMPFPTAMLQSERDSILLTAFGVACTEAILVIRTHALSGRSPGFLLYLSVQFLALCLAVVVVLCLAVRSLTYGPTPLPNMHGCHLMGGSPILFVIFVLLLLHENIVMIITLVIGFRKYRNHRTPLISTLYGDGTLCFVLLFLVSLANIFNLVFNSSDHIDLFTTFQRVMHSVLSTRILLHVRQAAQSNAFDIGLTNLRLTTVGSASAVVGELQRDHESVNTATLVLTTDEPDTPTCQWNRHIG